MALVVIERRDLDNNSKKKAPSDIRFPPGAYPHRDGRPKSHSPKNLSAASRRKRSLCLRSGRLRRLLTRLQRAQPSADSPSLSRAVPPCRSIGEACGLPTTGKYRPPQELTLPRNCRARAAGSAESTHPSTGAEKEVQKRSRRTASWLHPESGTSTKRKACYRSGLHQHPRFSVSRLPLGTGTQYKQRLPYLKKKKKTLSRLPDCEKKPDPGKAVAGTLPAPVAATTYQQIFPPAPGIGACPPAPRAFRSS